MGPDCLAAEQRTSAGRGEFILMDQPPKIFLLERCNQRFLDDHRRWTSQQRRSFARLVIASAICFCISLALLANHGDTVRLLTSGEKATATVVSKRIDPDTDAHYVKYRFSGDPAGAAMEIEKKTPLSVFDSSRAGNIVPILYNRHDPGRCLVGPEIASSSKDRAVLFGWSIFAMLLLAFMLFDFRMNWALHSKGIVLMGSLRSVRRSKDGVEAPSEAEVLYSFKEPLGSTINAEAKGRSSRSNAADFPSLGGNNGQPQAVAVLYFSDQKYILL